MPITQSRMLALIQAARAWQQAYQSIQQAIAIQSDLLTQGLTDAPTALADLERLVQCGAPPHHLVECVPTEEAHFRRAAHTNEAQRLRQATARYIDRDAAGLEHKPHKLRQDPRPTQAPQGPTIRRTDIMPEADILRGLTTEQLIQLEEIDLEPAEGGLTALPQVGTIYKTPDATIHIIPSPPTLSATDLGLDLPEGTPPASPTHK